jgi:hypothetical protein
MIKKMMLLAVSVGALVAFAVPATASANLQWHTSNGGVTTPVGDSTAKDRVHFEGVLTATPGGAAGPVETTCGVTAVVDVWNANGVPTGSVISVTLLAPAAGCHLVVKANGFTCSITSGTAFGGAVSADTEGNISIAGAGFTNKLEGCPVTKETGAAGTLTGVYNNETSCIDFEESGDLFAGATPVLIDGSLCETTGTLLLK